MYDQYGFYSDNIPPNGGPPPGGRRPAGMDFGGFDFAEFLRQQQQQAARAGGAGCEDAERGGGFPRYLQPVFRRRRSARRRVQPERGADLEYGLNIDFWQAIRGNAGAAEHLAAGDVRDLPRHRVSRAATWRCVRSATAPEQ